MKIESRVSDIAQEIRANEFPGSSVSRQKSVTSDFYGASTRKPVTPQKGDVKGIGIDRKEKISVPDTIDVRKAIEKLNKIAEEQKKDVSFSIDEESEASVIKVFRTHTGELIKQFPVEEILAMKARIRKNTGWFFDSKV